MMNHRGLSIALGYIGKMKSFRRACANRRLAPVNLRRARSLIACSRTVFIAVVSLIALASCSSSNDRDKNRHSSPVVQKLSEPSDSLTTDATYIEMKRKLGQLVLSRQKVPKDLLAAYSQLAEYCFAHDAVELGIEHVRKAAEILKSNPMRDLSKKAVMSFLIELADAFTKSKKDDALTDTLDIVIVPYEKAVFNSPDVSPQGQSDIDRAMISFVTRLISNGMMRSADILSTEVLLSLHDRQREKQMTEAAVGWTAAYQSAGDSEAATFLTWQASQLQQNKLYVRTLKSLMHQYLQAGRKKPLVSGLLERTTGDITYSDLTTPDRQFYLILAYRSGLPYAHEMVRRATEVEDYDLFTNYMLILAGENMARNEQKLEDKMMKQGMEAVRRSRGADWSSIEREVAEEKEPSMRLRRVAAMIGTELQQKTGRMFPASKQSQKDWMFKPLADSSSQEVKSAEDVPKKAFSDAQYKSLLKKNGEFDRTDLSGWVDIISYSVQCGRMDFAESDCSKLARNVAYRSYSNKGRAQDIRLFEKLADEMIRLRSEEGLKTILNFLLLNQYVEDSQRATYFDQTRYDTAMSGVANRMIRAHMYSVADVLQTEIIWSMLQSRSSESIQCAERTVKDWQKAYLVEGQTALASDLWKQWNEMKAGKMSVRSADSLNSRCRALKNRHADISSVRDFFFESAKKLKYEELSVAEKSKMLGYASWNGGAEFFEYAVDRTGSGLELNFQLLWCADRSNARFNDSLMRRISDKVITELKVVMASEKKEYLSRYIEMALPRYRDVNFLKDLTYSLVPSKSGQKPDTYAEAILADKLFREDRLDAATELIQEWSQSLSKRTAQPSELNAFGSTRDEAVRWEHINKSKKSKSG